MEGKQKFQQEFILLVVVMMTTPGTFLLSHAGGIGQPSVSFSNDTLIGSIFTAPNLTFSRDNATHIRFGFDNCKCRAACFTLGSKCRAWSFIGEEGNASECRIIDLGPETTNLINMTNATYFFKESSVGGLYTWGPDHLLYVELNKTYYFQEAKERCAKIPGHRLIIAHSNDTYNFFIRYQTRYGHLYHFWANLIKLGNGTVLDLASQVAQWGDGTNVTHQPKYVEMEMTIGETYFVAVYGDCIKDVTDYPYPVLCQANPLGVEW